MEEYSDTRTATSQVQDTYYGLPAVRAPHWRWLVIFYFFFGGVAGATYTIGAVAEAVSADRRVVRAARYLAAAAFLPCPPLLILDLGRPERALNMFRILKLKSPMSLGSWALFFAGGFATLGAGLQLAEDLLKRDLLPGPRRLVMLAGVPFSIFLSGYTGILLAATNIPLWWRSFPFLSPTFVGSAYSASLCAITLFLGLDREETRDTGRRLARAESICLAAELTFLTTALVRLGAIGRPLRTGKIGLIFWPVTYVGGILVPLLLQLSGPARGKEVTGPRRTAAAMLPLIGSLSLRAVMIFAGRESANRPEDYFAMTSRAAER
ncbi:MAG TPA: NrfD/PsrC family molybdoenzyme membrane anchor subunit [Chloroflexota bacterium]